MLVFETKEKPEYPEKKPLGVKERTNKKLNPHMALKLGFEPWPHLWEVHECSHHCTNSLACSPD